MRSPAMLSSSLNPTTQSRLSVSGSADGHWAPGECGSTPTAKYQARGFVLYDERLDRLEFPDVSPAQGMCDRFTAA